jgi:hypothetical protein
LGANCLSVASEMLRPALVAGALLACGGAIAWNLKPVSPRARALLHAAGALALLAGMGLLISGLRSYARSHRPRPATGISESAARLVLPGALRFERREASTLAGYRRSGQGGEVVEFAVVGRGRGYAPGLEVVVAVSSDRKILRVAILRHGETPSFMESFLEEGALDKFAGRSIDSHLEMGRDLDAVSGATRTSEGVAMAVRNAVGSPELGAAMRAARSAGALPGWRSLWKSLAACAYLLLLAALLPRLRGRRRLFCLGASVLVLGTLLGRTFSVTDFARGSAGMLPVGPAGLGALLFLATLAAVTLWRGRMWCSHACPFGALCELGALLTRAGAHRQRWLPWLPRVMPWFTLAAVALGVAWTGRTAIAGAEPFGIAGQILSRPAGLAKLASAALVPLAIFAAVLLASLLVRRFYCRWLCGAGLLLAILARVRAARRAVGGAS